jgi:hypothetical protein
MQASTIEVVHGPQVYTMAKCTLHLPGYPEIAKWNEHINPYILPNLCLNDHLPLELSRVVAGYDNTERKSFSFIRGCSSSSTRFEGNLVGKPEKTWELREFHMQLHNNSCTRRSEGNLGGNLVGKNGQGKC